MFEINFNDGSQLFPTKIIGVGLNYAAHIEEMNNTKPSEPVLFIKPVTSLCDINKPLSIPDGLGAVHHELELAVAISRQCSKVKREDALDYIAGFGIALDLTLRDLQSVAKSKGRPWSIAKGFDNSCPVSSFYKKAMTVISDSQLTLKLNGSVKQSARTSLMLFKIDELIHYISNIFTLLPGDIIITGTPSGVGPLSSGDIIEAEIENLASVKTHVI